MKTNENTKIKSKISVFGIIVFVLLTVYVICLVAPLFWAFCASLRDPFYYSRAGELWWTKGESLYFDNYATLSDVFKIEVTMVGVGRVSISMWEMYGYSILYSVGCSLAATIVPCVTAYTCSKFPCKLSKVVVTTVIVCMSLPIVGSLPSEIKVAKFIGIYDTWFGMWIMKANFLGLYFLVFYAAFSSVSNTYSEAAKIDGAGNFKIFLEIILPLVRNTFFTVLLIKFIEFWNDYQNPLIYMDSYPTIAIGLYDLFTSTSKRVENPQRMAGAMTVLFPILIVFIIFQKKLLGDLTIGGVKG